MAILVTGGAGYIGSVAVEDLRKQGETVVVLDNLVYGHRQAVDPSVPFYEGDIGDQTLIGKIISEHDIEACMHFSAFAFVGESVEKPQIYYHNNFVQTLKMLDTLIENLRLKNDAALSRALEVAPPVISKIRHHRLPVGASLLIRMHEVSDLSIRDLRYLMGDRRAKFRISDKQFKPKDKENGGAGAEQ